MRANSCIAGEHFETSSSHVMLSCSHRHCCCLCSSFERSSNSALKSYLGIHCVQYGWFSDAGIAFFLTCCILRRHR